MDSKKNNRGNEYAVIALLEESTDCLILTKRSHSMRMQPGEICFPGGMREYQDNNLFDTATRELQEELAISTKRVSLIKKMKIEKTLFNAKIQPWFASIESMEPYEINEFEVESVIKIPFQEAIKRENYEYQRIKEYDLDLYSLVYTASEQFIWGVTARIMQQFTDHF